MSADRSALRPVLQILRDSFRPVPAAHNRPVRRLHDIFDLLQRGCDNAPWREYPDVPAVRYRQHNLRNTGYFRRVCTDTAAVAAQVG